MNTKPFMFNFWVFVLMIVVMFFLAGQNIYQASVITDQRHTIQQFMGLEDGPDATPQPPQMPEYVPNPDSRKI